MHGGVKMPHRRDSFDCSKRNTTLYPMTNIELVYLQFRKILELIAFASLVANKTEYAKQRDKFYKDWHAERIIADIEKLNPEFYPVAGKQVLDPTTGKVIEILHVKSGFLTKADFVELYNICGSLLHAGNPFSPRVNINVFETCVPQMAQKNHDATKPPSNPTLTETSNSG
jgi:hypothetical protein